MGALDQSREHISRQPLLAFFASRQQQYVDEFLLPGLSRVAGKPAATRQEAAGLLNEPTVATSFGLFYFAFARAGGQQAKYNEIAASVFKATTAGRLEPTKMWVAFKQVCKKVGKRPNEKVNRHVLEGFREAHYSGPFRQSGLFAGISKEIRETRRVANHFVYLVEDVHLGQKTAALFLRDLIWIFDLEAVIESSELMFIQPIDIWVLRAGELVLDLKLSKRCPQLALAKLLSDKCLEANISGIAFNQGAWVFGSQTGTKAEKYAEAVLQAAREGEYIRKETGNER